MDTTMMLMIIVALVAAGVVIWLLLRQRSVRLRERFGPGTKEHVQSSATRAGPRAFLRREKNGWKSSTFALQP